MSPCNAWVAKSVKHGTQVLRSAPPLAPFWVWSLIKIVSLLPLPMSNK